MEEKSFQVEATLDRDGSMRQCGMWGSAKMAMLTQLRNKTYLETFVESPQNTFEMRDVIDLCFGTYEG